MPGRIVRRLPGPLAVVALALLAGACGPASAPPRIDEQPVTWEREPVLPEDCRTPPGVPREGGSIVLALGEPVDPAHAPIPHNFSERVVFRHLYETLVQVGCDGRLEPGLAESWEEREGGTLWILTLREGASFWDGTPVRAADVKRCWVALDQRTAPATAHVPARWLDARAASVRPLDARKLAVKLPEAQGEFPLMLAHPSLAVFKRVAGETWPLGSGPCRPDGTGPTGAADVVCVPNPDHPGRPRWERLTFRPLPGRDPRDLLGRECDALIVRRRAVLEYFEHSPAATVTALPHDRLYVLLCPREAGRRERERWLNGLNRVELARDVAAGDAEPVTELFFRLPGERLCPQLTGPVTSLDWPSFTWEGVATTRDRDLILHPEADEDARRLAERVAVLAAEPLRPGRVAPGRGPLTPDLPPPPGAAPEAVAVPDGDFPGALQSGWAGAYVLPLERDYASACLQLSALLGRARWLQDAALDDGISDDPFAGATRAADETARFEPSEAMQAARRLMNDGVAVPLVATREHLVSRPGLVGVRLLYDGTPLLDRAGWNNRTGGLP